MIKWLAASWDIWCNGFQSSIELASKICLSYFTSLRLCFVKGEIISERAACQLSEIEAAVILHHLPLDHSSRTTAQSSNSRKRKPSVSGAIAMAI